MKKYKKILLFASISILLFGCGKNSGYKYDGSVYYDSYHYEDRYCYKYFLDTNTKQAKLYSDIYLSSVDFTHKNPNISNIKKLYTFYNANSTDYNLTVNEMRQVFDAFVYENPEFYFLNEIGYDSNSVSFEISSKYYKKKERNRINKKIEEELEKIKSDVMVIEDGFERLVYLYDYIYNNMTYSSNDGKYYAHNIVGFFDKKQGVCETYAKTFTLLLNNYDFVSTPVFSNEHVWNCVNVCNNWFMFDLTENLFGLCEEEFFIESGVRYRYDNLMIKLPQMPTSSLSLGSMALYENGVELCRSHSIDDIYSHFDGGNYEIILEAKNAPNVHYRKFPINYINTNYSSLWIVSDDDEREWFDDVYTTYIILTHDLMIAKDVTIEKIRFANRAIYFGRTGWFELPFDVIVRDGATLTVSRKTFADNYSENIIVLND